MYYLSQNVLKLTSSNIVFQINSSSYTPTQGGGREGFSWAFKLKGGN